MAVFIESEDGLELLNLAQVSRFFMTREDAVEGALWSFECQISGGNIYRLFSGTKGQAEAFKDLFIEELRSRESVTIVDPITPRRLAFQISELRSEEANKDGGRV